MTTETSNADVISYDDFDEPKLPQMLNVLTILTFIGSAIAIIFSIASPWLIGFSKRMMEKSASSGREMSARDVEKMELARQNIELAEANMIPLMVIGLIGVGLCIAGAVMMRKLKKEGYWVYLAGQVIPIVGSMALMGMAQYKEIGSVIMLAFPIIFIILYTTQRKYLVR